MMNAVYAGSFDCYTNGHHDIVKKAAVLFDRLYIVIAVNSEKRRRYPAELMQTAIARTLENDGLTNCTVRIHDGVVADFFNYLQRLSLTVCRALKSNCACL